MLTRALLAGLTWLVLIAAAPAALAGTLNYHSGPVAHSMSGVLVSWGPSINSAYTDETSGDPGLLKYLSANSGSTGDIGGVLAQYMDSSGHNAANADAYGGEYEITPSVTSTTILDSQVQTELQNQIAAGHLPRPAGNGLQTIYLILFPHGDTECIDSTTCSGSYFCAYHGNTYLSDGTNVLYAVLPDNMSGPMSQGCGQASTLLQDQMSYLSHEWSETITDPLGTAWWDSSGNEVGDNCNAEMGSNGPWTVQLEWSNRDRTCVAAESAYTAPTASFLAAGTAAPGQQVSFDASSSSDPSSNAASALSGTTSYAIAPGIAGYQWSWGDGGSSAPATTATASHSYSTPGSYQVSLTVTDRLGFTSTVTHQIAIGSATTPPPSATTGSATGVGYQSATIAGSVNPEGQPAQYQFLYGTSPDSLAQSTPLTASPTGMDATAVSASLSGLSPSTTYYYRLDLIAGGQRYSGQTSSFTTAAPPPPQTPSSQTPPQAPVASTGQASQVTTSAATLTGTVNPDGPQGVSYRFAYGGAPGALTSVTPSNWLPGASTALPAGTTVVGLSPGITYYYRLEVVFGGQSYSGNVQSFTTLTPPPVAFTGTASNLTSTSAMVNGSVNPHGVQTSYLVEFGANTAYGKSTRAVLAGSGSSDVAVRLTVSGLRPHTTYHYRLVATSRGGTAVGADRTFITARAPGYAPRFSFRARASRRHRLALRFSCSRACSAHFTLTLASADVARHTPVPVAMARASAHLGRPGTGTASISLARALRARVKVRSLEVAINGYAVSGGSAPSPPVILRIRLP